ncbi:hypothetical protein [Streptomyces bottropensis]|jgi:hypothetical protein|uniref:Uncharacterized protein n=1 Tax=Streptomyces bottropensis ATCC 25435 TaxID=1054862 RepID=M3DE85_9ACTN|nr:hypothetical protein SBD_4585 [Streptomyces bottropensis ATCC 25435]
MPYRKRQSTKSDPTAIDIVDDDFAAITKVRPGLSAVRGQPSAV